MYDMATSPYQDRPRIPSKGHFDDKSGRDGRRGFYSAYVQLGPVAHHLGRETFKGVRLVERALECASRRRRLFMCKGESGRSGELASSQGDLRLLLRRWRGLILDKGARLFRPSDGLKV